MAANLPDSDENKKQAEPGWLLPAKIAVVVMGVMILGGLGVIAYTVTTRLGGDGGKPAPAAPVAAPEAPVTLPVQTGFGNVQVTIPKGARPGPAQFDDGRMILQMTLADGRIRLLILDLGSGTELGTIDLAPTED